MTTIKQHISEAVKHIKERSGHKHPYSECCFDEDEFRQSLTSLALKRDERWAMEMEVIIETLRDVNLPGFAKRIEERTQAIKDELK